MSPSSFIFPFFISFFITVLLTPLTISLAKKFGLVDNPKERPHPAHIHKGVIARAGGLPIFFGVVIAILFFIPLDKHIIGIFLGLLILLITGLLDDKLKHFSPYIRIFLQILAVGVVVSSGVGISFIANPLGGFIRLDSVIIPFQLFGAHRIIIFADLLAFFWIVWMMNIFNWSKGVDGQLPGISLISTLTIGFLSLKLFSQGDSNQFTIAILAFITAGASLGLLVFNWHPAKIFPGFSGSTILGFMVATLSILSGAKVATAFLVLLIPSVDFIYTFFRRLLRGQSPVWGDKGHLHHKLLELQWSQRKISLFYISSCAILGALAAILPNSEKAFTLLGVGIVTLGAIIWINLYSSGHPLSGSS